MGRLVAVEVSEPCCSAVGGCGCVEGRGREKELRRERRGAAREEGEMERDDADVGTSVMMSADERKRCLCVRQI